MHYYLLSILVIDEIILYFMYFKLCKKKVQLIFILVVNPFHLLKFPCFMADILATVLNQIGIVGRTGAGKSSILNALFRLNPICSGHILVDGINIADVSVRDLRSHFAVVPQTPFLFAGSLRYTGHLYSWNATFMISCSHTAECWWLI